MRPERHHGSERDASEADLADAVARGLKKKQHDDAVYGGGCVAILVLFFVLWGGLATLLGGSTLAVLVAGVVSFAGSFWMTWRLTGRYFGDT